MTSRKPRIKLTYRGREYSIRQLTKELDLNEKALCNRLARGASVEDAVAGARAQTRQKCEAQSIADCFVCRFDDCIRAATRRIPGELYVDEYTGNNVFRRRP